MSRRALFRTRDWVQEYPPEVMTKSERNVWLGNYIERYCQGDIDGFSILIAGERGAGKTTLAKLTIQKAMQTTNGYMPLPIFLHGPTIVDPGASAAEKKPEGAAEPAKPFYVRDDDPYKKARDAKEAALPKLITALYRHLSDALCEGWRNAAVYSGDRLRSQEELLELAGHLDRLLELAPSVEPLRKIWARGGFLRGGVGFCLRRPADNPPDLTNQKGRLFIHDTRDQGVREIVALAACADAYRGVLGNYKETWRSSRTSEQRRQQGLPPAPSAEPKKKEDDKNLKEAAGKIAPAALGALGGAAAAATPSIGPSVSAIAIGAITWIFSWIVLNYGIARSSKQGLERESTTEIDWTSIRVLERRLPALIQRVKDAGFAPIFILDELDKLDNAKEKLDNFLTLTKHIVNDEAAFFFLVNRDYYEELDELDRRARKSERTSRA